MQARWIEDKQAFRDEEREADAAQKGLLHLVELIESHATDFCEEGVAAICIVVELWSQHDSREKQLVNVQRGYAHSSATQKPIHVNHGENHWSVTTVSVEIDSRMSASAQTYLSRYSRRGITGISWQEKMVTGCCTRKHLDLFSICWNTQEIAKTKSLPLISSIPLRCL